MKQYLYNQKGSTLVLSLLTMMFLAIIISGIMPLVNSQILHSSLNNDDIEAQYAAEAGAKRAIVGIQNTRTDWEWADGKTKNNLIDETDKKYYITSVVVRETNEIIKALPPGVTDYTIVSEGHVNNAYRKITTSVKIKSGGVLGYAAFSKGDMLIQNPLITGDIYSNGNIKTTSGARMVTGTAYSFTQSIEDMKSISKGYEAITKPLDLDVNSMFPDTPSLSMVGTDLKEVYKLNQWGGETYPLSTGSYYFNGDYAVNKHSYSIDSGQNVTIYIKGTFSFYDKSNITMNGGKLTVYATNGINFYGGSILGNINSDINVFSGGAVNLSSNIIGGKVILASNSTIAFNGGSINSNLSGAISKVYAKGNVALNDASVISGAGTGMLVSSGNVALNGGTATNTIIIAEGNVQGNGGSKVAGIYANGTLTMTGANVTSNDTVAPSLGIDSPMKLIISWVMN